MSRAMRRQVSLFAVGTAFFVSVVAIAVKAQEAAPERCLAMRSVDDIRAVNDKTILFFLRGQDRKIFRNDVVGACPGLERNRELSYKIMSTRNPRLCKGDLVTIRESGVSCPLAEFRLVSEEEAENLTRAAVSPSAR
jgi:hypothetical protein